MPAYYLDDEGRLIGVIGDDPKESEPPMTLERAKELIADWNGATKYEYAISDSEEAEFDRELIAVLAFIDALAR